MTETAHETITGSSSRRVLLKLSGEAFGGGSIGIDPDVVNWIAGQIAEAVNEGVQVAIVVGGGNFFRGAELSQRGMERARADYIGMLGTVMNCLALQDFCEKQGIETRVQSAITMGQVAEPYIPRKAVRHLEKGRLVICAAGTGKPLVTTDTAAALRAKEMRAEVLLKGTKVDGIYTADPVLDATATKYDRITYLEFVERQLRAIDSTAVTFCMENSIPIQVFNFKIRGNLLRLLQGEPIGTMIANPAAA